MDKCERAELLARGAALGYAAELLAQAVIDAHSDQVFSDPDRLSADVSRKAYIELENIANELLCRTLEIEQAL